jgi:hypothetical protein
MKQPDGRSDHINLHAADEKPDADHQTEIPIREIAYLEQTSKQPDAERDPSRYGHECGEAIAVLNRLLLYRDLFCRHEKHSLRMIVTIIVTYYSQNVHRFFIFCSNYGQN